jgi:energy-coupling factor transport system substrate-specific component
MPVVGASLLGLLLFLWPFFGLGLPPATPAFAVALAALLGLLLLELGARRLDSRGLALLAAVAAVDAALRMALVTGIGGFSPVWFLVLCCGYVLGPGFGFLCGGFMIVVSALATGAVGTWVPYQVFAAGWMGALAGVAGLWRRDAWTLAAVAFLTGYLFGALMDIWDWTFFRGSAGAGWEPGLAPAVALARFGNFYLVSSLAYDSFRAAGDALAVVLLASPVLLTLRRLKARFTVEIVPLA